MVGGYDPRYADKTRARALAARRALDAADSPGLFRQLLSDAAGWGGLPPAGATPALAAETGLVCDAFADAAAAAGPDSPLHRLVMKSSQVREALARRAQS